MMYKLGNELDNIVIKTDENTYMPKNSKNRAYRKYLRWVDEGNAAEPADEETAIQCRALKKEQLNTLFRHKILDNMKTLAQLRNKITDFATEVDGLSTTDEIHAAYDAAVLWLG